MIAGAEQLLRDPADRAEREDRLVQVIRQARRASRLVDDLLLMTRLDTAAHSGDAGPTAQRRPVDPVDLIQREIDLQRLRRPDLDVRHVEGTAEPPAAVLADPDQLQRALGNLLENAAAATPVGGRIAVTRRVVDDRLSIRIIDTGPGVPDSERERIFDRFVRLSSSRRGEGSGLGLPISRAIARAHGGDLQCLAWAGGACFQLTLPAQLLGPTAAERRDLVRGAVFGSPGIAYTGSAGPVRLLVSGPASPPRGPARAVPGAVPRHRSVPGRAP